MSKVAGRSSTVALALLAACASAPHNPVLDGYPNGVNGHTSVDYYDVKGRTLAELRADMRRAGPKVNDSSFVGETRSPMRWTWKTEPVGTSLCGIKEANVSVNAQVLLPRWTPPVDTEPGLLAEWNRFIAALETHEAGHKDISAKAGRDIAERLRGLNGACSMISTRANDIARDILEKANAQQRAYDAETRHGLTQGTSFGMGFVRPPDRIALVADPRPGTVRATLPASLDSVWRALPATFAGMTLSINASDSVARVVGDSLTVRGTVAGMPMGEVLTCGVPNWTQVSESTPVTLFLTSRLETGLPSGSIVTNTLQSFTRMPGGAAVACRSSGALERKLLLELRRKLVGR